MIDQQLLDQFRNHNRQHRRNSAWWSEARTYHTEYNSLRYAIANKAEHDNDAHIIREANKFLTDFYGMEISV
jgi:hypothetical protein